MNGRLTDHPLVELIQEISDARVAGALRLSRERARAVVYFDGGQVAAALSNLRALRLAAVVRRTGAVEESRLSALVREGMSDEQAGLVLLRAGLLNETALKGLNERRSREVLRELLRWTEGEWSFDLRVRLAGPQQSGCLDASALLVEAARALPPEFAAARVGDEEVLAPAGDVQEKMKGGLRLLPTEAFALSRVYGPMRLSEVLALGGLPAEETRRAVYVLALAGLLERPARRRALSPEVLKQAARRPAAEAPAAPAQQEPAPATAEREQPAPAPAPAPDTRGTVEELLARASGATHYDVLGVKRSATADEIKLVYYAHARRLHPDRFRRDADEEARQQIDAAFARIAQAYETLKDATARAAYDLKLSKQRGGRG